MRTVDLDKIRRAAQAAMHHAVRSEEFEAWSVCGWIKQHCAELLYEDLWDATAPDEP